MAIKSCKVICCDTADVEYAVSVSAEILYDAVAQGLKIFRTSEWISHIAANTVIRVIIKHLHQSRFVALRDDKDPKEVRREVASI